jgi:hypothetical protein
MSVCLANLAEQIAAQLPLLGLLAFQGAVPVNSSRLFRSAISFSRTLLYVWFPAYGKKSGCAAALSRKWREGVARGSRKSQTLAFYAIGWGRGIPTERD